MEILLSQPPSGWEYNLSAAIHTTRVGGPFTLRANNQPGKLVTNVLGE